MEEHAPDSAFGFHATWRDFAPIAFTNLLLTIVTLGFYRFWATTRERQFLWSRTRFIDDRLEWTGTGMELFVGFLLALIVFGLPFFALQFLFEALILRGQNILAGILAFGLYVLLLALVGFALFRALRYRLSRTFWRGIRGGSDDSGITYARQYLVKTLVGTLAAGLLIPWSMVALWNDRWNRMSFGSAKIEASAEHGGLMKRFLLFYLIPLLAVIAGVVISTSDGAPGPGAVILGLVVVLAIYIVLPIIAIAYYAAYLRTVIAGTEWAGLQFAFKARSKDWLFLILGHIGLVIVTLGIGAIFIGYRNWSFFIRHLEAYGEIDLAELAQSTTAELKQGEGLLDAFDVGAF